eukprot:4028206-Ditylum_brightwellii.AAC.1
MEKAEGKTGHLLTRSLPPCLFAVEWNGIDEIGFEDKPSLNEKPFTHSSMVEDGESRRKDRASSNNKPVSPTSLSSNSTEWGKVGFDNRPYLKEKPFTHSSMVEDGEGKRKETASSNKKAVLPA